MTPHPLSNALPRAVLTLLLGLAAACLAGPAAAVTLDWVVVGDPGNAADPDPSSRWCGPSGNQPCGAVATTYRIGKYEVTNAQYAEFLNAKAKSDPLGLYNADMAASAFGGITRSGSAGSYAYAAKSGMADKPVVYVSFYDALRFANWVNNGQGSASTETGAYTLLGGTPSPSNGPSVTRNPGASIFVPSESEWYKAAYYDPITNVYFDYPAGTNTPTVCSVVTAAPNRANCGYKTGNVTSVGAFTGSASPSGSFDQGGNVWEWNEAIVFGSYRGQRGGAWDLDANGLATSYWNLDFPNGEHPVVGFRLASVPEPSAALLVQAGVASLALGSRLRQRRREGCRRSASRGH